MADVNISAQADSLLALNTELTERLQSASTRAWTYRTSNDAWSAAEIVGHMIEMEPFWARAAAALARQPGLQIGRELDDDRRLSGPKSGATLTVQEAVSRLTIAGRDAAEALHTVSPDALGVAGQRIGGARITVGEILDQLLFGHAREHVQQVLDSLSAGGDTAVR